MYKSGVHHGFSVHLLVSQLGRVLVIHGEIYLIYKEM